MISSILLAAGMSTRMGEPKALLPWQGEPLVCYQVDRLREAGADEVVVVLGHRADDIQRHMKHLKCRVLLNALHQQGKAGSLRIGAKGVNRDAESIIVLSVDQPRPAELTRKVLEAHTGDYLITRAVHEGRGGHPIVVAGSLRPELMAVNDATGGLKAVMRAHGADIHDVECGPECLVDVNTPDDFSEARSAYGATRA